MSQEQFDRVMHYIGKGKSEGAKLVAGGNRVGKQVTASFSKYLYLGILY